MRNQQEAGEFAAPLPPSLQTVVPHLSPQLLGLRFPPRGSVSSTPDAFISPPEFRIRLLSFPPAAHVCLEKVDPDTGFKPNPVTWQLIRLVYLYYNHLIC